MAELISGNELAGTSSRGLMARGAGSGNRRRGGLTASLGKESAPVTSFKKGNAALELLSALLSSLLKAVEQEPRQQ